MPASKEKHQKAKPLVKKQFHNPWETLRYLKAWSWWVCLPLEPYLRRILGKMKDKILTRVWNSGDILNMQDKGEALTASRVRDVAENYKSSTKLRIDKNDTSWLRIWKERHSWGWRRPKGCHCSSQGYSNCLWTGKYFHKSHIDRF